MKKIIAMLKGKDQRGISVILVSVSLIVLLGFVAFAIDFGYTYVARNQVQNAADAGALAGARFLINDDGMTINAPGANIIANAAAVANTSTGNPVTVNLPLTNHDDVQRGHWTFNQPYPECGTLPGNPIPNDPKVPFCPNDNLVQTSGIFLPGPSLDANLDFINAVKVVTHNTQVPSIFGKAFGFSNYQVSADAVAYLGFGSRFLPGDFDQPIAICSKSIGDENNNGMIDPPNPDTGYPGETLTCNIGRMLNSSGNNATNNTAGWTNFSQEPCTNANGPSVWPLICTGGNTEEVNPGSIGTIGGTIQSILTPLRDCWLNMASLDKLGADGLPGSDGRPDQPWTMTLPVIKCPDQGNVENCSEIVGAVNISVVWISDGGFSTTSPPDSEIPYAMYNPTLIDESGNPDPNGTPKGLWEREAGFTLLQNWDSFVEWFGLVNQPDPGDPPLPAPLDNKSVYFMPSCEWGDPIGTTGGNFFGVMAEVPVLVE